MARRLLLAVIVALTVSAAPMSAHFAGSDPGAGTDEAPGEPGGGEGRACDGTPNGTVAQLTDTTYDDEYTVRVNYSEGDDEARDAAEKVLDGALASYRAHVEDWSYVSADPDGLLEYIVVEDAVCTVPGEHLEIRIDKDLESAVASRGVNWTTSEDLYALATHHETNHHFLFSAVGYATSDEWGNWSWIYNGFASTSETWFDAEMSAIEDSPFYENNGADDYVADTGMSIFRRESHTNGLYLGYLYANDGGHALFEDLWEARASLPADADPKTFGPMLFDGALDRNPGAHDTFEASLVDFGFDLVQRENLSWAPPQGGDAHDWTEQLEDLQTVATLEEGESHQGRIGDWALEFTRIAETNATTVRVYNASGDPDLRSFVYVRDGDSWSRTEFVGSQEIEAGHDEVLVTVLRNASSPANYTVTVGDTLVPEPRGPSGPGVLEGLCDRFEAFCLRDEIVPP